MDRTTPPPTPPAGNPTPESKATLHVADLLRHGDADLVQRAYRCILGRDADESGLATYVAMLRDGATKTHLLATLAQSSEARGRKIELAGLEDLINAERPRAPSLRERVVRRLLQPLQAQPHALERSVRIVDNHMHRLQAVLELQTQELIALRAEVAALKSMTSAAHAAGVSVNGGPAPQSPAAAAHRQVPPRAEILLTRLRRAKALRLGARPS